MQKQGIYCITNIVNKHKYIGSSIEVERRQTVHFSELKRGQHTNPYLQNAYNKYGKDSFIFEIIELVEQKPDLIEREQYWIDLLETTKRDKGFNIQEKAGRAVPWLYKKHHTEESKQKSRDSNKGQKRSLETREKLKQSHLGKVQSEETKEKRRLLMKGNTLRKGLPSPMRGKKQTAESIRKRTETRKLNRGCKNDPAISLS